MPESLRINCNAPDLETADVVKELYFKQLYNHNGMKVIFEVPGDAMSFANEIKAKAESHNCKVDIEEYTDPLGDAEAVDFW